MPLLVENDVNTACEGEAFLRQQSGQGKDMLYMSLGTGCGGALRMNGKLQRGARCRLGEVGYMLLHPALGAPRRGQPQDTLERAVLPADAGGALRRPPARRGPPERRKPPLPCGTTWCPCSPALYITWS